jgi:S-DNA-T family DNA segregation ATPase FtsK/SpoIIIE
MGRPAHPAFGGELGGEVGGIFLLGAAGVALVSLLLAGVDRTRTGSVGLVGAFIAQALEVAFGRAAYVVPLLFACTGVLMLWRKTGLLVVVRLGGLAALSLCTVVLFEVAAFRDACLGQDFIGYVTSSGSSGGGAAGAAITWVLLGMFGYSGTLVVLSAFGLTGLVVLTNVPVRVGVTWAWRKAVWALGCVARAVRGVFSLIVMNLFEEGTRGKETDAEAECAVSRVDTGPGRVPAFEPAPTVPVSLDPPQPQDHVRLKPAPAHASGLGQAAPGEPGHEGPLELVFRRSARPQENEPGEPRAPSQQLKLIEDSLIRELPPLSLLRSSFRRKIRREPRDPAELVRVLEETLASFGVAARVVNVSQGPMVTRFEVQPGVGVKVSKIVNLADDLALAFAASGVRIEAPIPGKAALGIEVPNREKNFVLLREVLESPEFQTAESRLTIALGKDIAGSPVVADMADILHLLVAGATGSGKSVCLNAVICSLLFKATPDEVKFLMIDPKRVELSVYDGIPHLLAPVVTEPKKASGYLRWVVEEMENRYRLFQLAGARNIAQYNDMISRGELEQFLPDDEDGRGDARPESQDAPQPRPLPYIVVIVDELADLMIVAQGEVEDAICRLAFMARAAGIHLIIATQRPSVDIITGIIKANIPSRIAFAVSSQVDSRIILDTAGAERLLGKGDMLFHPVGLPKPIRVQGAFISDDEVADLVAFLKRQGAPDYQAKSIGGSDARADGIAEDDELFADAARLVVETGEASISKIQRRYRVGYARAARLIDTMEVLGIVGPYEGSKPRKVLMTSDELEEALSDRRF